MGEAETFNLTLDKAVERINLNLRDGEFIKQLGRPLTAQEIIAACRDYANNGYSMNSKDIPYKRWSHIMQSSKDGNGDFLSKLESLLQGILG